MLPALIAMAGGKEAVFSSVLKGIGSVFKGRSARKEAKRKREHEEKMAREQIAAEKEFIGLRGEQDRLTQKEGGLLEEWMRQNKRSEVSRGSKNFTQFAGSEFSGYTPASSPVQRKVTPDEFIRSGGIIGDIAQQPSANETAGAGLLGQLGDTVQTRPVDGQLLMRP